LKISDVYSSSAIFCPPHLLQILCSPLYSSTLLSTPIDIHNESLLELYITISNRRKCWHRPYGKA